MNKQKNSGSDFQRVLVSGGAGFIGSALVRMLVGSEDVEVINVDALTYAGDLSALDEVTRGRYAGRHYFFPIDINDSDALKNLFLRMRPQAVIHLAAETHVDRSIDTPLAYVQTNVVGTLNMLEAARMYWNTLPKPGREKFRFLHVSTDEVYGDIAPDALPVDELGRYAPSSPYAASKAGADHLVRAWHRTYGLPICVAHCCNNYGAYQHPEKLIPHMIFNALSGKALPIYGDGQQQRQWVHVDDHVRGLWRVLQQGHVGESYHIGAPDSLKNIDLVNELCDALETIIPARQLGIASYHALITHVPDRPGHDRRYALSTAKIASELGWRPQVSITEGLLQTVSWYARNREWWQAKLTSGYQLQRQGIIKDECKDE